MKSLKERWKQESSQVITTDPSEETKKSIKILKTDEDQHLVFGWASVAITVDGEVLEDRQHDMIDPEDLEEAAYEYVLNFRDTGEEHLPGYRKKGKLIESCVFTPEKQKAMGIPEGILPVAWWIGFKIDDEDTWQRVKNGTYKMFSIEGKAEREEIEKAAYDEWLEENMDKFSSEEDEIKFREWKSPRGFRARTASDVDEIDSQWDEYKRTELKKTQGAKTFEEVVEKFNPYHDALGRFTHANAIGARASLRGKTENGQRLLDQFKEKHGGKASGGGAGGSEGSGSKDPHEGMEFDHMNGVWVPKKPKTKKPKETKPKQEEHNYKKINNAEAESMAKEMGQTRDQMSEKDYDDMTGWEGYINTGNSFSINQQLRDGVKIKDMSDSDRRACEALDRNMKPSTKDIKVGRMCGDSILERLGIKDSWDISGISDKDLEALKGKVTSQEGYSSTSFDMKENVFGGRPVKMNINVPKGAKMLISPTRDWDDRIREAEIILPRDCPMKITGARKKKVKNSWGETQTIIELDIDVLLD